MKNWKKKCQCDNCGIFHYMYSFFFMIFILWRRMKRKRKKKGREKNKRRVTVVNSLTTRETSFNLSCSFRPFPLFHFQFNPKSDIRPVGYLCITQFFSFLFHHPQKNHTRVKNKTIYIKIKN